MSPTSAGSQGSLPANRWTKVLWGWGFYTVRYHASISAQGGQFKCYSAPSPFPIASGPLPNRITHTVVGYGDVWLLSPVAASYSLVPVSAEPLSGWPNS
ncbi:MAG: hypothetical protein QOE65_2022 [Solirubrobacteraceae bacterium]|jgi:hypothetical protein|nr:hypothetical protein [Solirubrobacteraceae bacterium]